MAIGDSLGACSVSRNSHELALAWVVIMPPLLSLRLARLLPSLSEEPVPWVRFCESSVPALRRVTLARKELIIDPSDMPWKIGRSTGRQLDTMAREHSMRTQYAVGAT